MSSNSPVARQWSGFMVGTLLLAATSAWVPIHAQSSVSSEVPSNAPVAFLNLVNDSLSRFDYRRRAGRNWLGLIDRHGRAQGNCTVFAALIRTALDKNGYITRFVNVELLSTERGRDRLHVVTVAAHDDGSQWVFDNRDPYLFPADELRSRYVVSRQARAQGSQRRSWREIHGTAGLRNRP